MNSADSQTPASAQTVQQSSLTAEPTPMMTSSYPTLGISNPVTKVTSTLKETSQPVKINEVNKSIVSSSPSSSLSSTSHPSVSSNQAVKTQKVSLSRSSGPTLASLMSFSSYPAEVSDLSVQGPLGGDSGVIAGPSK